ncbi:MAG TPA: choice-of-anchor D domain-containing protein, partial [Solirubrobacterales bacterium]|nr:choice-of-anchor D domain-containing protein [Solirubrobacterales bacterium]
RACFGAGAIWMLLATVWASAALAATSNLEFDPPAYDFGAVPYESGPTEAHQITLTNTAGIQLTIKRWRYWWGSFWPETPDPFGATSSDCHTLEPGESCSLSVTFDPIHPGPWKGGVKMKSQVEEEPWAELALSGEGTGPWLAVSPNPVVFSTVAVGLTTPPQTITLESRGYKNFTLEDISFSAWPSTPSPFRIVGGSCHEGDLLGPGGTCTIEVVMVPTVPGLAQSELVIADTAPDSPQSVELEGTATEPVAQSVTSAPVVAAPPLHRKRLCPKGKRKVFKKGRRVCVKKHPHRRHR